MARLAPSRARDRHQLLVLMVAIVTADRDQCVGVAPRVFFYPQLPQWDYIWNQRLGPLHDQLRRSKHHTSDGACADFFVLSNHQFASGKKSSATVVESFGWIAHTWPWWNQTAGRGLVRHLLLMPCDHGPGDCMYDRAFVPRKKTDPRSIRLPESVNPLSPRRTVAFLTENGAPGDFNYFIRGLDIRLPSGELHDCGPFCGTPHAQRPRTSHGGRQLDSGAQQVLRQFSPWAAPEAEREALLRAPRRHRLFWAGRASGRKGFRGDLFRLHTNTSNHLREGWLLHDTSGRHTPVGAAPLSATRRRGWFAQSMSRSDFCYSPPGHYHGDSDRYLPAVLYGCIPIFVKDGETPPFDDVLPWAAISLQLGLADVGRLHEIIAAVGPAKLVQMRLAMAAVWRRIVWTSTFCGASCRGAAGGACRPTAGQRERGAMSRQSPTPRYLGEDASQDAFATFIDVLRARLRKERGG